MGKKDNEKTVSGGGGRGRNGKDVKLAVINNVPNRDIMQRMNFLWQASVYFESLGGGGDLRGGGPSTSASARSGGDNEGELIREKRRPRRTKKVDGCDLAKMYVRTMNIVGQRTTTKMDPSVKRTLCRCCSSVLIPGISARIRTRPSRQHEHWMIYTCLKCGTSRRIPAPRNRANDSPQLPEVGFQIGIATTRNIDTPIESLGEEQQRLVQSSNSPHFHPVRQQQLQHHSGAKDHSEEHVGDKKGSTTDAQMDVSGDQRDHSQGNIVIPHEKAKALLKQKKTKKKKKKKKVSTAPPPLSIPRQPPLFARKDAGHVVYRGGEIIDMEGVYCV